VDQLDVSLYISYAVGKSKAYIVPYSYSSSAGQPAKSDYIDTMIKDIPKGSRLGTYDAVYD
jgi:hypothetical protein